MGEKNKIKESSNLKENIWENKSSINKHIHTHTHKMKIKGNKSESKRQ